jgi:hypothetical protein
MGFVRGVAARARRKFGRAIHDAGGATQSDVRELRADIERVDCELRRDVGARLDDLSARAQRTDSGVAARLESLENRAAIESVSRFIRYARLRAEPLVSVVLPTHNRPDLLRRAIDSVLAQRYTRWELLVVDDGGEADSQVVVEATGDDRVHWQRIDRRGVSGARNAALASVTGEIVTYLDDDNVLDPEWLYSVVWAFEQRPDVDVLYGAFVIDDQLRLDGSSAGDLPRTFLSSWSRDALRQGNLADMGAIAHRSGLKEARFDEGLLVMGDWDLLLRLTADRDPLVLPAISCYYTTDAPSRLTGGPTAEADLAKVIGRAASAPR